MRRLLKMKERQRAKHKRDIMDLVDNLSESELEKVNTALRDKEEEDHIAD